MVTTNYWPAMILSLQPLSSYHKTHSPNHL